MSPFDAALPSTEDVFSVIEAIHDNVAIVDHNGVMRWVSSCFERNYGISRDRVIGRTTYELEAEKVFSPSVAALVLKTRRVVTLTEATRSGQYNIVTGVPIYDDDGDVCAIHADCMRNTKKSARWCPRMRPKPPEACLSAGP